MRAIKTELPGVLIIEADVRRDARGFFLETYHVDKFREIGIDDRFVQDNHSQSVANTIRGLHLQVFPRLQSKLVRAVEGEIIDVSVDVRRGSPTFGQWVAVNLSAENFRQCYIPAGFAHGFAVISQTAQVQYKCGEVYAPDYELGIAWDDPEIGVTWPIAQPLVSARDRGNPRLAELIDRLPVHQA